jgi:hypothetical protein
MQQSNPSTSATPGLKEAAALDEKLQYIVFMVVGASAGLA